MDRVDSPTYVKGAYGRLRIYVRVGCGKDFFLGQPHNEDVQRTTDCRQFTRAALDGHACVFEEDIRDAAAARTGTWKSCTRTVRGSCAV